MARRDAVTSGDVNMEVLALLTARLCHEMSGPITSINNGIELLADEEPNFVNDAIALVGDSACRGANRLQFYRFAYGSAMAGATPHELANRIFDAARIVCDYRESVRALPLDWQKLACNLLLVGAETLPRGGRLVLAADPLDLEAVGEGAALSPQTVAALTLVTPLDALTSRTVQAYFTGLLAEALGCRLVCTKEPRRVRLTAVALAA